MEFLFSICYGTLHTGKPLSLAKGQGLFGLTGATALLEDSSIHICNADCRYNLEHQVKLIRASSDLQLLLGVLE